MIRPPLKLFEFSAPFANGVVPNVFPMNVIRAGNPVHPCVLRIRNITNVGFEAVCQEPFLTFQRAARGDRNGPAMVIDYIAIVDGVTIVPVNDGGSPVLFDSGCQDITAEQFRNVRNRCPGCDEDQLGFDEVFFDPASNFSSPPTVLTQLVSTNNSISVNMSEPVFIDVAYQENTTTTSSFNVAIERMEAGSGLLSPPERLCYLATEAGGCRDLNLNSIGGPNSVQFNAVFGGNVDGFDNGATTGEGATFAAGCFMSMPIAVAKQNSYNGPDGGMVRRDSVNSSEIILTYDEDRVRDTERAHIFESVSALAFGARFTTPVTMNSASVEQSDRTLTFQWETAAESFHLGFNLWGERNGEWVQLNRRFIASSGVDQHASTDYRHTLRVSRQMARELTQFGISSVDNSGYEEFYGPFQVGEEYGQSSHTEPVDWTSVRDSVARSMSQRGFIYRNGKWRRVSEQRQQKHAQRRLGHNRQTVDIPISDTGIHSIDFDQLMTLPGIHSAYWTGKPLDAIAVSLNGNPVPREILSDDEYFNAGDQVIFAGVLPTGTDSIYLDEYVYQLRVSRQLVRQASHYDGQVEEQALSNQGVMTQRINSIAAHNGFLDSDNPWFDRQLLAIGSPSSTDYQFNLEHAFNLELPSYLSMTVFGGISLPGDAPDHHVQIILNGEQIADRFFDGSTAELISVEIPRGVLKHTNNQLQILLPGDTGFFADLVQIDDGISISGFVELDASEQSEQSQKSPLSFKADTSHSAYVIRGLATTAHIVAYDKHGSLSMIQGSQMTGQELAFEGLALSEEALRRSEFTYSIATPDQWRQPVGMSIRSPIDFEYPSELDYLIVAHPSLMGAKLDEFVSLKESQGLAVEVMSWLDLVDYFGFGNNTPAALDNFLSIQSLYDLPDYVLLVGGHTFDYRNLLNQDAVNLLPSHYRQQANLRFAPTDNPYADLNKDNIPDLAIGRWPARTQADLDIIVDKTTAWHLRREGQSPQSALLLAQSNDSRNLNYVDQTEGRIVTPLDSLTEFSHVNRLYLPDFETSGAVSPIDSMRHAIANQVKQGVDLVTFAGHGSNAAWGTQTIVNTDFVKQLNNGGLPPVVMPLACYTTHFESTSVNTLAHQWLFANTGDETSIANSHIGAVAVHGATVLGEYRENAIFAERYLQQAPNAHTVGEAIKLAKQQMSGQNSMLHNWSLLGDPALPLR